MTTELGFIYNVGQRWTGSMLDISCKVEHDNEQLREPMGSKKFSDQFDIKFPQKPFDEEGMKFLQNCKFSPQYNKEIIKKLTKLSQFPSFMLKLQLEAIKKMRLYADSLNVKTTDNTLVTASALRHFFRHISKDEMKRRHSVNTIYSAEADCLRLRREEYDAEIENLDKSHPTCFVDRKIEETFPESSDRNSPKANCKVDDVRSDELGISDKMEGNLHETSKEILKNQEVYNFKLIEQIKQNFCESAYVGNKKNTREQNDEDIVAIPTHPCQISENLEIDVHEADIIHRTEADNSLQSGVNNVKYCDAKINHPKSVRFADEIGRNLVHERRIIDEIAPSLMTSENFTEAFSDRDPLIYSDNNSTLSMLDYTTKNYQASILKGHRNFDRILIRPGISFSSTWKFLFEQPSSNLITLKKRLEKNNVCLENIFASTSAYEFDIVRLFGKIRVKNITFHKTVGLRITTDNWKSFQDYNAQYCEEDSRMLSYDSQVDTFEFSLPILQTRPSAEGENFLTSENKELQFAVFFRAGTLPSLEEYWDNNQFSNYIVAKVFSKLDSIGSYESIFY